MKEKRTEDRNLLDHIQGMPCLICKQTDTTVGHHIISKGAGGPDEPWNLVPLCANHHTLGNDAIHKIGTYKFSKKFIFFKAYLDHWKWRLIKQDKKFKWIKPIHT